jgi:hypothetical protein
VIERACRWRNACTAIAVAAAVLVAPLPALAADSPPPTPAPAKPGITASADRAAVELASSARVEPRAPQPEPKTGGKDKWSFFKSPAGALVLGAVAAGAGYAIYSTSHDRVHSPGKQ